MRFSASEKQEIIRLVEGSDLPVKLTLEQMDIPKSTFYDWYGRYKEKGFEGLMPRMDPDSRQWNQIPEKEREEVVKEALDYPYKSPRELAFHITDTREWFISESSVYRILKSRDLITSPTHIVMRAADRFKDPPARVNELWQTDFSIPEGGSLGMVLPDDHPGSLFKVYYYLGAVQEHASDDVE